MMIRRILMILSILIMPESFCQGFQIEINTSGMSPTNTEKTVTFVLKDYLSNLISVIPLPMKFDSYTTAIACRNQMVLVLNNGMSITRSIESNIGSPRIFTFFFSEEEMKSIRQSGINYIQIVDSISRETYSKSLNASESRNLIFPKGVSFSDPSKSADFESE